MQVLAPAACTDTDNRHTAKNPCPLYSLERNPSATALPASGDSPKAPVPSSANTRDYPAQVPSDLPNSCTSALPRRQLPFSEIRNSNNPSQAPPAFFAWYAPSAPFQSVLPRRTIPLLPAGKASVKPAFQNYCRHEASLVK